MYDEWNHDQTTDPGSVQTALQRFRRQEDGRMVSFLHGKAVLLDKRHLDEVSEGEWWLVSLDHRETFAIATPVERFDVAAYVAAHPELFEHGELAQEARGGAPSAKDGADGTTPTARPTAPAPPVLRPAGDDGFAVRSEVRSARPANPPTERVALFVDSANMNHASKRVGYFIDWKRALDHFSRGKEFAAAYFYIGVARDIDEGQQGFLDFLSHTGYIVRRKPVKTGVDHDTGEEYRKANLDIEIVLDMMATADLYDTCYLFSGDSDFERAVEALRSRGKKVHIVSSRASLSRELGYVADKPLHFIEELEDQIARTDRRPGEPRPSEAADELTTQPNAE